MVYRIQKNKKICILVIVNKILLINSLLFKSMVNLLERILYYKVINKLVNIF